MSPNAAISKVKLFYFNIKGKGEPVRLACHLAGLEIEDVRVDREEFQRMKAENAIPFGQLPYAQFYSQDGAVVCEIAQMRAILRTIARACDNKLYSDSIAEQAVIDQYLDFEDDMVAAVRCSVAPSRFGLGDYKDDSEKLARRAHIASEILPLKLQMLEDAFAKSSTGWVANTAGPTIADLPIFYTLGWISSGILDGFPTDILAKFPKILAFIDKFSAQEEYKAF
mmetsp:Transcript_9429/g.24125  ORF Transcript_9429/g.24125 Transcript_9429/m.24125 type:complete len:225 (-) Transcript_9429:72-746(-)